MNYRWNQNHLNYKEDFEALRRGGFTENEIEQLTQLRRDRTELELSRNSAEYHRLAFVRSEEHTSELQSQSNLVCRLLLEKKNKETRRHHSHQRRPSLISCHNHPLQTEYSLHSALDLLLHHPLSSLCEASLLLT